MKNKEKLLDVVFVLDKSGSMAGSEEHTISSFNEYLEKEKTNKFNTNITTVLFNDHYSYLHKRKAVSKVNNLTDKEYSVEGCTALYDSLGNAITFMEQEKTDQVLFIIITDGYENASSEYSKDKIRKMIKKHTDWEFIYIGADIDSYAAGGDIGIRRTNIANYRKDKKGISKLFKAAHNFEEAMMSDGASFQGKSWKEDLDNYLEENKN
jgi:uncharacterized protein YegL